MFEIFGHKIYENLNEPCNTVDTDKNTIMTLQSIIEDIDWDLEDDTVLDDMKFQFAGNDAGIDWAKTPPDEHGIYTIIVDAPSLTYDMIYNLAGLNIIQPV